MFGTWNFLWSDESQKYQDPKLDQLEETNTSKYYSQIQQLALRGGAKNHS